MKKFIALMLCLSCLLLTVMVSCKSGDDENPDGTDTEPIADVFTEGLIIGQDWSYFGVPRTDDNQKVEKYEIHFWYTLDPAYTYQDAEITMTVHLIFHDEDGAMAAEQTASYTLRYDENGELIGEEPTVDEFGNKSLFREVVVEEQYESYFYVDTDIDFDLTCSGTVFAK